MDADLTGQANEPAFPLPRQNLVPPGHSAPPEPNAATIPEWAGTPIVSFGLVVSPMPRIENDRLLYAEVVPAGSRWLPWPGRTSRWWFEVHAQHAPDEYGVSGTTYAYVKGGSGGAFTLRGCIAKAMEAVDKFVWEDTDDAE